MVTMTHRGTYQDYSVQSLAFSRSIGMTPDIGHLIISFEDAQSIEIEVEDVHWRCQAGAKKQVPVGVSIQDFFTVVDTVSDNTYNDKAKPPEKGFKEIGDLDLATTVKGGAELAAVRYADIYIDTSGMSDITPNLKEIRSHSRGFIRLPITDIRKFWRTYGYLYQRINTTLKTGKFDPLSIQENEKPFTFFQVLSFLFGMLPGCCPLHSDSGKALTGIEPPEDIPGDGQPPPLREGVILLDPIWDLLHLLGRSLDQALANIRAWFGASQHLSGSLEKDSIGGLIRSFRAEYFGPHERVTSALNRGWLSDPLPPLLRISKTLAQAVDHAFFVDRVHQDWAFTAQCPDQRLGEPPHRRIPRKVEELGVIHPARRRLIMAGPLERQGFVWPRTGPNRHGRHDRLEVEVIARIRKISNEFGGAWLQLGLSGGCYALNPLLLLGQPARRHITKVTKTLPNKFSELCLATCQSLYRIVGL